MPFRKRKAVTSNQILSQVLAKIVLFLPLPYFQTIKEHIYVCGINDGIYLILIVRGTMMWMVHYLRQQRVHYFSCRTKKVFLMFISSVSSVLTDFMDHTHTLIQYLLIAG